MYKYCQLDNQINRKIFIDNHRQSDKQTETEERNSTQTVLWYKKTTFNVKTLKVRDVSEITSISLNKSGKLKNVTTIVE